MFIRGFQALRRRPNATTLTVQTSKCMFKTIGSQIAPLIRTDVYDVRLAGSFAEIDAAMRLRFEVFNLELQEGLQSSHSRGYDQDAYDAYCDHLILKEVATGQVVGTYRLLRRTTAERNIGFYSENEFDLRPFKELRGEIIELGRSCIAQSHRSFAAINLLWKGIVQYAMQHNAQYLFGCCSLHCSSPEDVLPIYSYLRSRCLTQERFRVQPVPSCRLPLEEEFLQPVQERDVWQRIPPVMKGYLRAGAMICGAPAYDAEFGTADLLVLLEMRKISDRYRIRYQGPTEAQLY